MRNIDMKIISEGLKRKYLNEMAHNRKDVIDKIWEKHNDIRNHLIKAIIYKDSLTSLNHWCNELASKFNWVNNRLVKTKSRKLSEEEYLENVFSINSTFSLRDAKDFLDDFLEEFAEEYPSFEPTDKLDYFFLKYKEIAYYFTNIFVTDTSDKNRTEEFKEKLLEMLI